MYPFKLIILYNHSNLYFYIIIQTYNFIYTYKLYKFIYPYKLRQLLQSRHRKIHVQNKKYPTGTVPLGYIKQKSTPEGLSLWGTFYSKSFGITRFAFASRLSAFSIALSIVSSRRSRFPFSIPSSSEVMVFSVSSEAAYPLCLM